MAHTTEGSPAKRVRLSFTETIEVLVGTHKKSFTVHKDIIRSRSPFFKAASERWNKECRPVELLDDDPDIFDLWLQCVYFGELPVFEDLDDYDCTGFEAPIKTYILSDKLGDLRSANSIIDGIIRYSDKKEDLPPNDVVMYAWNATPETSQLRRLLIDYTLHEMNVASLRDSDPPLPPDMYTALLGVFGQLKYNNQDQKLSEVFFTKASERPMCYYHQHNESHPKCAR